MLAALALALALQAPDIQRDAYGVPLIVASDAYGAFYGQGFAAAQDRLWQMETSRRIARARMAEVFGRSGLASDVEIIRTGYTDGEMQAQFAQLSPDAQTAFRAYADGVNAYIAQTRELPPGYAQNGFRPQPWTVLDSFAIGVRFLRQFGTGGAGELRNMAMLAYMQSQPKVKDQLYGVMQDFLPLGDPHTIPTVARRDDPLAGNPPRFFVPTRRDTEAHLAMLPKLGLLELLPAIRVAEGSDSRLLAEQTGAPFKAGSYAVVVHPSRSATGRALLLSAPQMGFSQPQIVHEVALRAPGMRAVGMDLPGYPGVLIGHTPEVAWGLTSGVMDNADIVFYRASGEDGYLVDGEVRMLAIERESVAVKGEAAQTVERVRTEDGPVIFRNREWIFAQRSSYWKRENASFEALIQVWRARNAADLRKAIGFATVSFNFFYATSRDIGFHYAGIMPVRPNGLDPRLPTPGGRQFMWQRTLEPAAMPHTENPRSGLIANWNNKPTEWWPQGDTPTWSRLFRNRALLAALPARQLRPEDLELAAWRIAREEITNGYNFTAPAFMPHFRRALARGTKPEHAAALAELMAFDGLALDGSSGPAVYEAVLNALRETLFLPNVGSFVSPDFFRTAIQPALVLAALEGRTAINYRGNRTADEAIRAAFDAAATRLGANLPRYRPGQIAVAGQTPIPYSNRGTYIQIVELGDLVRGRNVLPPGVATSGPNSQDQVPLAREWRYKPMRSSEIR